MCKKLTIDTAVYEIFAGKTTNQELAVRKPKSLHESLEGWLLRKTDTVPAAADAFVS